MSRERKFDPRANSMVALVVNERNQKGPGERSTDYPLKHFTVGPHIPADVLRTQRPYSSRAATGSRPGSSRGEANALLKKTYGVGDTPARRTELVPKFLDPSTGRWVQEALPDKVMPSQSQPLSATATFAGTTTGTLRTAKGPRSFNPVVAVHSFGDISPVITAEFVRDDGESADPAAAIQEIISPGATAARPASAFARSPGQTQGSTGGVPKDTRTATEVYWRLKGGMLSQDDLQRSFDLGKNVVPGSANCRLVGGRWKYIPRPTEGDAVYTDYYGAVGGGRDMCSYYGRVYHMHTKEFQKSTMVGDNDYQKVQASMPGIQSLRARSGIVVDKHLLHSADPQRLGDIRAQAAAKSTVHRISEFARMRPVE